MECEIPDRNPPFYIIRKGIVVIRKEKPGSGKLKLVPGSGKPIFASLLKKSMMRLEKYGTGSRGYLMRSIRKQGEVSVKTGIKDLSKTFGKVFDKRMKGK